MKAAKEWIKGWNLPAPRTIGNQDWNTSIKMIQLDAIKEGMKRASELDLYYTRGGNKKLILRAAEKLTVENL